MNLSRYGAISLALMLAVVSGCTAERLHKKGMAQLRAGQVKEGFENLESAVEHAPENARYRLDFLTERQAWVEASIGSAVTLSRMEKLDASEAVLLKVLAIFPSEPRVGQLLSDIARKRRIAQAIETARKAVSEDNLYTAELTLSQIRAESPDHPELIKISREISEARARFEHRPPILAPPTPGRVSLKFVDASVRMVFEALSRASGLRFIFDKDIPADSRVSIDVSDVYPTEAVDLLLHIGKLEKKVLDEKTAFIFSSTMEKAEEYRELVIKSFFLSNVEARQAESLVKSLLKVKDSYVDERLNLLVIRDTPDVAHLAEKLINLQDVSEPEVMLELAVLEVTRSRLTELGIDWPDQISVTPLPSSGEDAGNMTWADLKGLNSGRVGISPGSALINLRRELTDSNLLANPRIRARNKEKANILIGDRVPVLTTTSSSTGFVSENVQYLDVGLKLDVQPTVYLDDEVAIRVGLEVSSLVREIRSATGLLTYQIGTRTAGTTLRLKDGETQVLAGLINDEDRSSARRIPGLGDLPVLNRLLGSKQDSRLKTEILLSITPRILRNIRRPDAQFSEFWSGTGKTLRTAPVRLNRRPNSIDAQAPLQPGEASEANQKASNSASSSDDGPLVSSRKLVEPKEVKLSWRTLETVEVGDQFEATLIVQSDGDLRALPLQLAFDSTAFEVLSVAEGAYFAGESSSSSFSSQVDRLEGKIFVSTALEGGRRARGDGSLLVIKLKALSAAAGAKLQVLGASPITGGGAALEPLLPPAAIISVRQ